MKATLAALLVAFGCVVAEPVFAQAGAKPEVKMYATSWCPYCAKARAYFARRGIAYVEVDIEKSREGRAEYDRLGARGSIPVILVGPRRMNGFSEARLSQLLAEAGY
jgi:mycoredoxin